MSDTIDASGLTVQTATEIKSALETDIIAAYNDPNMNLDSNTSDGQLIGIITQLATDLRELVVSINNSFDPSHAVGTLLDERVSLNKIQRSGGTYTIQPIDIVTSQTVSLTGLDSDYDNIDGTGYTVQDSSGNEFILIDSVTLTAGTYSNIPFRSKAIGAVQVTTGTITKQTTTVIGVTSVNNSSAASTIGVAQETDAQLRTRRDNSVAINAKGYDDALRAALLSLDGVTSAQVYSNDTDTTDSRGIPDHGIWCIVADGAASDIGAVIYSKKSQGSTQKGSISQSITKSNGDIFLAKFDRPTVSPLYIKFNIKTTISGFSFDTTSIKSYFETNKTYSINESADTASLTAVAVLAIADQGGGGTPNELQISLDGSTWVDYLAPTNVNYQFAIASARITITVLT